MLFYIERYIHTGTYSVPFFVFTGTASLSCVELPHGIGTSSFFSFSFSR